MFNHCEAKPMRYVLQMELFDFTSRKELCRHFHSSKNSIMCWLVLMFWRSRIQLLAFRSFCTDLFSSHLRNEIGSVALGARIKLVVVLEETPHPHSLRLSLLWPEKHACMTCLMGEENHAIGTRGPSSVGTIEEHTTETLERSGMPGSHRVLGRHTQHFLWTREGPWGFTLTKLICHGCKYASQSPGGTYEEEIINHSCIF